VSEEFHMMTVPTDHGGLEVLTFEESMELLGSVPVGRVAFIDGGEPLILPVNHVLDGRSVAFRSSYGTKQDAAWRGLPAAFEADEWDTSSRTGWSVLVRGTAELVLEDDEVERLDAVGSRAWVHDPETATRWIRLRADEVSGRRIIRLGV
jgi:uncharacterized protein